MKDTQDFYAIGAQAIGDQIAGSRNEQLARARHPPRLSERGLACKQIDRMQDAFYDQGGGLRVVFGYVGRFFV